MKKILLLAIATGMAITVCAQKADYMKSIGSNQSSLGYMQFMDIKGDKLKSFEANGYKLDSVIYAMWNPIDSTWSINNIDKYDYYPDGKQHWFYNWHWGNSEEKWIASVGKESLYDEAGRLAAEILRNWDESQAQWTNALKSEYFYDENGNDTLFQNSNWNAATSEWYATQKYENIFDDNGYKTNELVLQWNLNDLRWDSAMIKEFYNDEYGRDTLHFMSYWETNESGRILLNKVLTYYDENGNDTLQYYYFNVSWQSDTVTWIDYVKGIHVYDANGWIILESSYTWDDALKYWMGGYLKEFTNDEHGNAILIYQYWWDSDKSQWTLGSKLNQYFSEFTVSEIPNIREHVVFMYPNPAREFVYFKTPDFSQTSLVEIYDIKGRKVLEQKLTDTKQVSITLLSRGLYFYKLHINGTIFSGKILKE